MPGIKALRKLQLGRESTAGTAVAATTRWRGLGTIEDAREVSFPEEDVGILVGVDRTYIAKLAAALTMDEVEATFEQLPHILEAGVKTVSPTTDTGSAYIYTYDFPTTAQNTIKTYTIEGGDNQQAEEMEYSFVKSFSLTGQAGEALMMSADWIGRQVTNTSFTASTDAPIPTVDEILFSKGTLFVGDDTDTFGTTDQLLSNTLLAAELQVETGLMEVYAADGQLYFSTHKQAMPEITLNLTFEHDSNSVTEKTNWRNETARIIRLRFDGPALSSTGTLYDTKRLLIDLCGKWESFEKIDEQDGNDIIVANFRARYNATQAKLGTITVVNELSALP